MREICRGLEFPEGPIAMPDGSVILVEIKRQTLTRVTANGDKEIIAQLGGGPNGAALGPDGRVYVCNNGGFTWGTVDGETRPVGTPEDYETGSIQAVDINTGEFETLYTEVDGRGLRGPNDIVFDRDGGFYFTDLGKRYADRLDRGGVYYARPDGSHATTLVHPFETANGIGLSPDEKTLYVAETLGARMRQYHIESPGVITKSDDPFHVGEILRSFDGYARLDSLAVDSEGNVCVATLGPGCVTAVAPNGEIRAVMPVPEHDVMVTNVCFGGADMKTAFVTSSGLGRLYAAEWHCAGHKLNFNPYP